jgi:hypothetical protein
MFYSDYDEIDLPVFTCSSRDYVRITGQVRGDGDPSCFSNVEDTGIPSLRQWCHQLTISSRSRASKQFHTHLKTFANSVRVYVDGIGDVTIADRESLREKWESTPQGGEGMYDSDDEGMPYWRSSPDPMSVHPFRAFRGMMSRELMDARLFSMNNQSSLKVNARGEPIGVTPRLVKVCCLVFSIQLISLIPCRNSVHMLKNVSRICKTSSVMVLKKNVK